MALQMVRSFFGQSTPSRSRVHEPVIGSESLGNQEGNSSYDRGDVGKSAASNWFELARHPTSELGRKPHNRYKLCIFGVGGHIDFRLSIIVTFIWIDFF